MLYENVFRMLAEKQIRYVVAGGVAVVLHGIPRSTMDLDIIVHLEEGNVLNFVQGMAEIGFLPKAPVKAEEFADPAKRENWIQEKGMKVFSFYHPKEMMSLVDVFVEEPIRFSDLYRDKVMANIGGIPITLISREHLKQLKKVAGRPEDIADLKALNKLEEIEGGK